MEKARRILQGDIRTASHLIRDIEDNVPEAKSIIGHLFPHTGKAYVIGVTGSPGAGKSTIIDSLIESYRSMSKSVGVLLVDPTSPFTGGAILGDRIRMQRHIGDKEVFVRSLATRGALGGLSKAVGDAIHILDAMGKDVIIIETVGTGQQEVEIINHAHTVVVVLVPGMGDEIQAIKAGIMEIGDIFVINKGDSRGASKLSNEIQGILELGSSPAESWHPHVMRIESMEEPDLFQKSVDRVVTRITEHMSYLIEHNLLNERIRRKTVNEFVGALRSVVLEPVMNHITRNGELDKIVDRLMKKETDPYSCAEEVAREYFQSRNDKSP